jgi:drug/metabolite transporter (DMT)-like permease
MFLIVLLQLLSAVAFILFKKTLLFAPPFLLVALRMLLGSLPFLIPIAYSWKPTTIELLKRSWKDIVLAGFVTIYITNGYALWSMQYVTAAFTSFIYNLSPFVSALCGFLLLGERMTKYKWLGLGIGIGGFIPVIVSSSPDPCVHLYDPHYVLLAKAGLILSAVTAAYGWVFMKQLVYAKGMPLLMATGSMIFVGGLFSLAHSMLFEQWHTIPVSGWTYITAAAVVSPAACSWLYMILLGKLSSTFVLFSGLIATFFTAILGWIFLGEDICWTMGLSAVIVGIGLLIFYRAERAMEQKG